MKNYKSAAIAASLLIAFSAVPSVAGTPKPVELSAAELAAHQTKTYAVPSKAAFGAVVAALQSMGYTDIASNRDSGTVSGVTEAKGKIFYNILWGFGKKKLTQKASLLVEENGETGAMVRLNLHVNETKARGIFGTSFSDGKIVRTAEPYTDFWTVLDSEIARRTPAAAEQPATAEQPAAVAPEAAPASTAAVQ